MLHLRLVYHQKNHPAMTNTNEQNNVRWALSVEASTFPRHSIQSSFPGANSSTDQRHIQPSAILVDAAFQNQKSSVQAQDVSTLMHHNAGKHIWEPQRQFLFKNSHDPGQNLERNSVTVHSHSSINTEQSNALRSEMMSTQRHGPYLTRENLLTNNNILRFSSPQCTVNDFETRARNDAMFERDSFSYGTLPFRRHTSLRHSLPPPGPTRKFRDPSLVLNQVSHSELGQTRHWPVESLVTRSLHPNATSSQISEMNMVHLDCSCFHPDVDDCDCCYCCGDVLLL